MKTFTREFDWKLLLLWLLLVNIGIVFIFSTSTYKVDNEIIRSHFWWKQIIFFVISLITMYIIIRIPTTILDVFVFPVYLLTISLLILVLFMPPINNANRWIVVAGMRFQPSEFAKIIVVLVNARLLAKENISSIGMVLKPFLIVVLPFVLILLQPDLGTAIVLVFTIVIMLIQAGFPIIILFILLTPFISMITSFYLPGFIIFAILLIGFLIKKRYTLPIVTLIMIINLFFLFITPVMWGTLKPYQQNRILIFLDPSRDPLNAGYQVIQAKIAVGSGQILGKGFLEGTQKNMNFLPEHHTDFIFSVIAEETGFIGSSILLFIFLIFFIQIIKNIDKPELKERKIAIAGFLGFIGFQVIINISMNLGLLPTTGIPLPFISYGGSNLLVNSIAIALTLKYTQDKDN